MGEFSETESLMLKCQAVKSSVSLSSEISRLFFFLQIMRKKISEYKVKCSLEALGLNFGKGFEELALNPCIHSYSVCSGCWMDLK